MQMPEAARRETERRRIALVACVKSKRPHSSPASELYISPLFKRSRAWAETYCDGWFILSAKFGLVMPVTEISPYEVTLNRMGRNDRRLWAERVYEQMWRANLLTPGVTFVWLTGKTYKEELSRLLGSFAQEDPMAGLALGPRLQWLKQQTGRVAECRDRQIWNDSTRC